MSGSMSITPLWQAVYNAYETHDTAEARRLLQSATQPPDCSSILRCGDEDYIRWLLSHDLLPAPSSDEDTWPGLQELQLQCQSVQEVARPDCILKGTLPPDETTNSNPPPPQGTQNT